MTVAGHIGRSALQGAPPSLTELASCALARRRTGRTERKLPSHSASNALAARADAHASGRRPNLGATHGADERPYLVFLPQDSALPAPEAAEVHIALRARTFAWRHQAFIRVLVKADSANVTAGLSHSGPVFVLKTHARLLQGTPPTDMGQSPGGGCAHAMIVLTI